MKRRYTNFQFPIQNGANKPVHPGDATMVTGCGCVVILILLKLAFFGAICWVAWHFISKYW